MGCSKPKDTICGVPVQGTTWELAAAIADYGDGTFVPECVIIYGQDQNTIEGWYYADSLSEEIPAEIICELKDGEVFSAVIDCEIGE